MNPCQYTAAKADAILDLLAAGKSLRSICEADDAPDERTVRRWAIDDIDNFAARYERARIAGCHTLADEILEIADAAKDSDSAAAARVQCENRRWLLSKLLPRTYGDKLEVNSNVTVNVASELIELRRRASLLTAAPTIEALPAPEAAE